jgi:hypothetical protein
MQKGPGPFFSKCLNRQGFAKMGPGPFFSLGFDQMVEAGDDAVEVFPGQLLSGSGSFSQGET